MIVKLVGVHHEHFARVFVQTLDRHTISFGLPGDSLVVIENYSHFVLLVIA
jgi:hypothetical protein